MENLISEIKKFCKDNYDAGYDTCVECWSDCDYAEWLVDFDVKSVDDFINSYKFMIERQSDISSTAF